jgi:hypothetical protein
MGVVGDLQQYIMPTRLTDATEDSGLFGIRFGQGQGFSSFREGWPVATC